MVMEDIPMNHFILENSLTTTFLISCLRYRSLCHMMTMVSFVLNSLEVFRRFYVIVTLLLLLLLLYGCIISQKQETTILLVRERELPHSFKHFVYVTLTRGLSMIWGPPKGASRRWSKNHGKSSCECFTLLWRLKPCSKESWCFVWKEKKKNQRLQEKYLASLSL